MDKRYMLQNFKRFTLLIAGFPASGKTIFSLAPHPFLGDIAYVPMDVGAEHFEGIPFSLIDKERVKVYRPSFSKDGIRFKGKSFSQKILDFCSMKIKEKTLILDTATAMTRYRFYDEVEIKGLSKYHKENEMAQHLIISTLDTLYHANPHLNIIFLHHLKELRKPGEEMALDTWTPDIIGSRLLKIWYGQFSASLITFTDISPKGVSYRLLLKPTTLNQHVRFRAGISHPLPPYMDITCKKGDYEPLLSAWDVIFRAFDSVSL